MVTFDHRKADQGRTFELERTRLTALLADMEKISLGAAPEQLGRDAPILDHWVLAQRPTRSLPSPAAGSSAPGRARPTC